MNRAYFKVFPRVAATALLLFGVGCGGESESACADGGACQPDAGAPGACSLRFAGNYEGTSTTTTPCASLAKGKGDAWTLTITGPVSTTILIDLGRSPTTGEFTSETVETWSAVGGVSGTCAAGSAGCQPLCEYSAGNDSAPQGSFVLALRAIDVDASTPVAHGALEVTQDVHAGPDVECGPGDAEQIAVDF